MLLIQWWSFKKNIVKPICIMMYTYVIEVGKRFNDINVSSKLSTAMHNIISQWYLTRKIHVKMYKQSSSGFWTAETVQNFNHHSNIFKLKQTLCEWSVNEWKILISKCFLKSKRIETIQIPKGEGFVPQLMVILLIA